MTARPDLYVGLMSGTSLDGIDVAIARFPDASVLATRYEPYPEPLRTAARALLEPGANELDRAARLANDLTRAYAAAIARALAAAGLETSAVSAIGCHGQTVRHQPRAGYTIQLINGALLAELTAIPVVCDFRSRDIAAGGEGAPLVPAFHDALFRRAGVHRVIVNLGGIGNVTDLAPARPLRGFDTGPANCLLDDWAMHRIGTPFDRDGALAAGGKVDAALLAALLAEPYFAAAPPKSTGRELFNLAWLERHRIQDIAPADVQATLAELTAQSVARAIREHCAGAAEAYFCGGGSHNSDLMRRLRTALAGVRIETTTALGIAPDFVEAVAFAWLAHAALEGETSSRASVTGARGDRVLGAVYPR